MSRAPSAAQWRVIEPLLDAVLDEPPDRRASNLRALPTHDVDRDDIMAMAAACERLDAHAGLFAQPAAERFAAILAEPYDDSFVRTVADRFVIEREAGRGGMGVVFVAMDRHRQCRVALKVLRTLLGERARARFAREIELAARLRHPNLVPLLESGEDAQRLWYTMPFLDGDTLATRLRRNGPLTIPAALDVLRDVATGLAFAHEQGVVHRDLKPENIVFSSGRASICDFGVARAIVVASEGDRADAAASGGFTTAGAQLGTLAYMAPEQATNPRSIDHRADLYALGVVAYEMFTGRLPLVASSRQAMLTALLVTSPPPISRFRPDIPVRVERVAMQLLAKVAADRPASARDVLTLL